MVFFFTETRDGLRYDEPRSSSGWRVAFGIAGTLALLGSGIFVVLLRGTTGPLDAARIGGIAASLLGLAAFWAFGLYCLYVALLAPQQSIFFDLQLREQPGNDDPSTFCVEIHLKHARPLKLGIFDDRESAATHLVRVRDALGRQ